MEVEGVEWRGRESWRGGEGGEGREGEGREERRERGEWEGGERGEKERGEMERWREGRVKGEERGEVSIVRYNHTHTRSPPGSPGTGGSVLPPAFPGSRPPVGLVWDLPHRIFRRHPRERERETCTKYLKLLLKWVIHITVQ